jgi:hypothetical protein
MASAKKIQRRKFKEKNETRKLNEEDRRRYAWVVQFR